MNKKRILIWLLVLAMIFSILPAAALAEDNAGEIVEEQPLTDEVATIQQEEPEEIPEAEDFLPAAADDGTTDAEPEGDATVPASEEEEIVPEKSADAQPDETDAIKEDPELVRDGSKRVRAVPKNDQVMLGADGEDAPADNRIVYTGSDVNFYAADGTSTFGMLSLQSGSAYVIDGDYVRIYDVPSNKTVYGWIHWGLITDGDLTEDVTRLDNGCWEFKIPKENCGYGIPVAPIKVKGGTTSSQYYLCIPAADKLQKSADYTALNSALASVPDDLSRYTAESAAAVTEAVAATEEEAFFYKSTADQGDVDAVAAAINTAVAGLVPNPVDLADGVYTLPELSAGPSEMFNHFVSDSRYLIVSGDTAKVRFITDGSTASVQKYSKIALGKSSELVSEPYQTTIADGTTVIEGKLQPATEGTANFKAKYLYEIPLTKAEAAELLANDVSEDIYITVWNNKGAASNGNVPGWYKASNDIYLSLGTLGEAAEAPAEAGSFGFTLQVGQYTEGADFHTASFDGVEYALKDAAGNVYEPSSVTSGMLRYSNLYDGNTYTFTAAKEGWSVVKQGEWNVDAHAYEYIFTGDAEISVTITKDDADKNISEYTNPGMIFRKNPREENEVDRALASVPEDLNYDLFTDETAGALRTAIEAADPESADPEQLTAMANAITQSLGGLVPKDGRYEVSITKYNGTPYYLFDGLADNDKNNGKAVLVVSGGKMTAEIVLKNQSYGQVCLGTKDEVIAAATEAGTVPEGTIDLTMPAEQATYNGKSYKVTTGTIPVPALQTKIAYAYHSSNTTRYTYNTGWYDHGVMFLANSLVPEKQEMQDGRTDLSVYDEELMFKLVNAYIETENGQSELVFALSGKGYEDIYAGTYDEAIANGNDKSNWIHYTLAEVECVYETASGKQNDGTAEKYQFRVPVTLSDSGVTRIPITAISHSRQVAAENANPDNPDYSSAFTARQAVLDINAKTLRTGNYQDTVKAAVTSSIKTMPVSSEGEIFTIGTPLANEYTCEATFTLGDKAYDAYYKGDAETAASDASGVVNIAEDGLVTLRYKNSLGQTPEIDITTGKVTVAFRAADTQEWINREIVIDPSGKTIAVSGDELPPAVLKDGTYRATKVTTDVTTEASGMIMVTQATVVIKDGVATAMVTMKGTGADRLYVSDTATAETIISEAVAEEKKETGGEFGNLIGGLKMEGSSAYTFWPVPVTLGEPKIYAARSASHFSKQDVAPEKYYYVHDFQIDAADLEYIGASTKLPVTASQEAQRYLNQYFKDGKVTTSATAGSVKGKDANVTIPYYDASGNKISNFVFKMAESDKFRSGWFVDSSILNTTYFSSSNLKKIRYPEGANGKVTFSPKAAYRDEGMTFTATLKLYPSGTGYDQYDADGVYYDAAPLAEQEFTFVVSPLPGDRNVTVSVIDSVSKETIGDAVITVIRESDGSAVEAVDGVYPLTVPETYTVKVSAEGYVVPGTEDTELITEGYAPKKDGETLTLNLIKSSESKSTITFDLKDQMGETVKEPTVKVYEWSDKTKFAEPEPDGTYRLYRDVRYGYTVTAEGYEEKTSTILVAGDATEEVLVNKYLSEQKFTFRVYDNATNETLKDAVLTVKYGKSDADEATYTVAVPDGDGVYTIPIDNRVIAYGSMTGYESDSLGVWSLGFDPLKECSFGLKALPAADYTAVDAALAKVPEDLSPYTEESAKAVRDAVDAVDRSKKTDEQTAVDAMAKAIEDAVAALVEQSSQIDLLPTNEELMFKVVNAFIEKTDSGYELVFALSGNGYEDVIPGTYDQAMANQVGASHDTWIHGSKATVDQHYYTDRSVDTPPLQEHNDGTASKWQFRLPIDTPPESGTFKVPVVAVSKSRYQKAEKADPEAPDYSAAFTSRQFIVNMNDKTVRTGNLKDTLDVTVTSNVTTFAVSSTGKLYTVGTPKANEYTCQPTITMQDSTYDMAYLGAAEEASAAADGTISIGDDKSFVLGFFNTLGGKQHIVDGKATAAFHVSDSAEYAEAGQWIERTFTFDLENNKITIDGEELTVSVPLRIKYDGENFGFYKEDGVSSFGMLSPQVGSSCVIDGDTVKIYNVPSNKTVYDGIHFGLITDENLTKDIKRLDNGCWEITMSTDDCGYGVAVAPVKQKDGKTTSSQYYLCIPEKDKIPAIADYSAVEAALAKVPEDLSVYTEESAKAVTDAVAVTEAAGFYFKSEADQAAVDAAAQAIEDAVAALVEKDADYSAVDAAIAKIPEDLSIFTDDTVKAINDAVDAVDRTKKAGEQATVDAMAKAIEDAVAALEEKGADYSAVDAALAKVPKDLSIYTDDTAKAISDAVDAVDRTKKITEQSDVDAMAKAIEDAVAALEEKDADYSAVDAAIAKIPEDLSKYDKEAAQAVRDAVDAVERGKKASAQSEVDAMAKAIEDAVAGLTGEAIEYTFSVGGDGTWTKGSSEGFSLRVNRSKDDSRTFSLFTGIAVDGKTLASSDYTASSGSLKATLKAPYLETLTTGKHKLTVSFSDGTAETSFSVTEKAAQDDSKKDEPKTDDKENVNPDNGSSSDSDKKGGSKSYQNDGDRRIARKSDDGYDILKDNDVPLAKQPTGDDSIMAIFIAFAACAAAAVVLALILGRRRYRGRHESR